MIDKIEVLKNLVVCTLHQDGAYRHHAHAYLAHMLARDNGYEANLFSWENEMAIPMIRNDGETLALTASFVWDHFQKKTQPIHSLVCGWYNGMTHHERAERLNKVHELVGFDMTYGWVMDDGNSDSDEEDNSNKRLRPYNPYEGPEKKRPRLS